MTVKRSDLVVTRGEYGGWRVTAITSDWCPSKLYLGYTKREAISLFLAEYR